MLTLGSNVFHHKEGPFAVKNGHSTTDFLFKRRLANGEEVNPSWLVYSPSHESAFFLILYCSVAFYFPRLPRATALHLN